MTASVAQPVAGFRTPPEPQRDEHRDGIEYLFSPSTIAVIGASRRADTIGHEILHNLIVNGFHGAVYPVNPAASAVCSVRSYPSIGAVGARVDVAVIAVPKERVLDVAEECGSAGVKGLIVISAGFREIGPAGLDLEKKLVAIVRRHGMRMVGPNCMGIVNANPFVSMNATFCNAMPPFGNVGFVSQSGALGLSVLDYAREYGIGFSQFVSVGNKPDVSGNDVLEAWEHDPTVGVILMYVENFGNPRRFLEIASRVTKTKPIIVVKSGRSRAGARAATSHTGALAANDTAVGALLTQAGVLRASSVEELFDMAIAFGVRALPRSRRTAVLTNAGGPGILAADAMEACGIDLAELSPATVERLRPLFPAEASIRNPLDMIASATPVGYRSAMTALLDDPAVDAVVPIFVPPFGVKQEDVAEAIVGATGQSKKTVLAVMMGREGLPRGRAELQDAHIPTYIFPESAARALSALNRQAEWVSRVPSRPSVFEDVDGATIARIIGRARADGRTQLTQIEALESLRAYGITTVRSVTATTADEACAAAERIGYPVVLKIISPDIVHKTDIGAVRIGLRSPGDIRAAYREMMDQVHLAVPKARIDGVIVQEMVTTGRETIVGMTRDASFGPLVMFGLGGVFVEALGDVVFRIAPLGADDARAMMASIRGAKVLDGFRGAPPVNRTAVESAICRIAQLGADFPEIAEIDVNPLSAGRERAVALDARMGLLP